MQLNKGSAATYTDAQAAHIVMIHVRCWKQLSGYGFMIEANCVTPQKLRDITWRTKNSEVFKKTKPNCYTSSKDH